MIRIAGKSVTGYDTLDTTDGVNADLVFLGSSRCWNHFNPEFFNKNFKIKSINLGMNGISELSVSELRLKNYLLKNKKPKYAILNIDPIIKSDVLLKNKAIPNKNDYSRYAFFPSTENIELVNFYQFNKCEKYIPLFALFKYKIFTDCITLKNSNIFPKGYEENDEKWDTIKYPKTSKAKKFYVTEKNKNILYKKLFMFKKFCETNNIKILCIQTPVYKSAYDFKSFEITRNICKKMNIPFIDMNTNKMINNIDNFFNTLHLNKNGVQKMNEQLKNDKTLINFLKN